MEPPESFFGKYAKNPPGGGGEPRYGAGGGGFRFDPPKEEPKPVGGFGLAPPGDPGSQPNRFNYAGESGQN